ncbi:DUF1329 domain-containing protein [Aromatoleum toluclasticum]|uniref:DUF1329 domain-containing protein n=1 Tax=Aromatoleum toluclasticum TaxID=92003 RepID=UPI000B496980|nr:DUF1329 domain-containing protein [Aromatoleum toluclasticum]MCC4114784.1 DUF1329 domain-containing protein [Aromatoleum toluclasticum]
MRFRTAAWRPLTFPVVASLLMTCAHAGMGGNSAADESRRNAGWTPWGAVKESNRTGSIPAWSGGLPADTRPPGFVPGSGRWADPFAAEKPLYTITADNLDQHRDKLSETAQELLRRRATFRIDVYPTHRVVNYSAFFLDHSNRNRARCRTKDGGLALSGCFGGTPFPAPRNGIEAMWNVQLAHRAPMQYSAETLVVDPVGKVSVTGRQEVATELRYHNPALTPEQYVAEGEPGVQGSAFHYFPQHIAGDHTLVSFFIDPVRQTNTLYRYQHKNRRVVAVPNAQYDYPIVSSGGGMFVDESGLYFGKMDRFDFRLLGVREMIIPYSNYRAAYAAADQLATDANHPNPDLLRWELHRVLVVEAVLKSGMRHEYARRRWYIDEDYPAWGMADAWDHSGRLYRGYFGLGFWMYDKQAGWPLTAIIIDMRTGSWILPFHFGDAGLGISVLDSHRPRDFYSVGNFTRRVMQ